MTYYQIALLALIQGAAELLPVSSSAHVNFVAILMGLDPSKADYIFTLVMMHTGTMLAVILYFWRRWWALLRPKTGSPFAFPGMVGLASVCTLVLGFALKELLERTILLTPSGDKGEIEVLFKNLPLMAVSLFAAGVLIVAAGFRPARTGGINAETAILIGIVQGLCLPFRGFSRSGATISTALFRSVSRPLAEDFSFALGVVITPAIIVHSATKLYKNAAKGDAVTHDAILQGFVALGLSFVAGLVALRLLSSVLEKGHWAWFGYYCLAAAAVVFATSRMLNL
jgi:undecaprenyl-diphosphatase